MNFHASRVPRLISRATRDQPLVLHPIDPLLLGSVLEPQNTEEHVCMYSADLEILLAVQVASPSPEHPMQRRNIACPLQPESFPHPRHRHFIILSRFRSPSYTFDRSNQSKGVCLLWLTVSSTPRSRGLSSQRRLPLLSNAVLDYSCLYMQTTTSSGTSLERNSDCFVDSSPASPAPPAQVAGVAQV